MWKIYGEWRGQSLKSRLGDVGRVIQRSSKNLNIVGVIKRLNESLQVDNFITEDVIASLPHVMFPLFTSLSI